MLMVLALRPPGPIAARRPGQYALVPEELAADAEGTVVGTGVWRWTLPVVALLAIAGTATWSSRGGMLLRVRGGIASEFEAKAAVHAVSERCGTSQVSSKCGAWEANTEFQVDGGWYASLDHVPSAEMCCAMCQGAEECKAFTWVKDAGLSGCPSQCWLKGGLPSAKVSKAGFVSGLPPARPALPPAQPPAAAAGAGANSIFGFSLMVPGSYEEPLLELQYQERTSIFGCDAWAVYSNVSKTLGAGIVTRAVPTTLDVKFGGDSYTALNSWIFIAVWKKVIDEKWHELHKWIVKVDPDAVFFPERLRPIVAAHPNAGYINNCKYGLHGPIEVLSNTAVATLAADYKASFDGKAPKQCVQKLNFGEWGEDFFLSRCMWEVHGITKELDEGLMCEAHCDCSDWYWCDKPGKVTFHPLKRPDMYKQCMANALAAESSARGMLAVQ